MSIVVSDISYHYFNQHTLFESVSFSISQGEKVSLIGNNGVGKSTLLKLLAGELISSSGNIRTESKPYYVPQQINIKEQTIAEALGVSEKINALNAIYGGSSEQIHYDILNDDWDMENRCHQALEYWGLRNVTLDSSISLLSGGEKTKVLLAGLILHKPDIVLLDEPTNHLDLSACKKLYEYISSAKASVVVVSHDVSLLNLLDTTYGLSPKGIRLYGGNYDFYREQKAIEDRALEQQIHAEQTALRVARKKAQEVRERQEKRSSQGEHSKQKDGVARIIMNARGNLAENSSTKLREKHSDIINNTRQRLSALRDRQLQNAELKINFEDAKLHKGKILISAHGLNFGYMKDEFLWQSPINIEIRSGERIHVRGNNGSGKTTFLKLLLRELSPIQGKIIRSDFSYVYLDQEYEQVNQPLSLLQLAEQYNKNNLADHEIKLRLNRALFPLESWDKNCQTLSGGERMRLYLCCLMISNHIPDIFVLDEPTNNLDLSSLSILTETIKNYRGTILIISHDEYFINEIGVTNSIQL
jgi:ATPase subunit of ABC transporter with duplicated ATPase domains